MVIRVGYAVQGKKCTKPAVADVKTSANRAADLRSQK